MESESSADRWMGPSAAIGAYLLWGFMPIYWKWIHHSTAQEILAHRIIWSFVFMMIILPLTGNLKRLFLDIRQLFAEPKRLITIIAASVFITVNWYTFIWAVGHGHVVGASLGYYINPLISVLLGIIFLKERLSLGQLISIVLAFIGVLMMTVQAGDFPWVSLTLAFSFGLYGLMKKTVRLRAMTGLTIETFVMTPAALCYLFLLDPHAGEAFPVSNPQQMLLLIGAGIITAVPLLLFAAGANRIPLAMVGFLQYIAPTLMLILGTLLYHEPFNRGHLLAFLLIWVSLLLFSLSGTRSMTRLRQKLSRNRI